MIQGLKENSMLPCIIQKKYQHMTRPTGQWFLVLITLGSSNQDEICDGRHTTRDMRREIHGGGRGHGTEGLLWKTSDGTNENHVVTMDKFTWETALQDFNQVRSLHSLTPITAICNE